VKKALIGFALLAIGGVLIFGNFHLYVMFAGGPFIILGGAFLRSSQRDMIRNTMEKAEKKRMEKRQAEIRK
jgi:hypothetical protein